MNYKDFIRSIPDFPVEGILFRDITPLLNNSEFYLKAVNDMLKPYLTKGIDAVAAIESRGYLFGAPIAQILEVPLIIIRKPGKLPWKTNSVSYELEYGTDTLEMHEDAIQTDQNVLIVDDLLATGGTAEATCKLIEETDFPKNISVGLTGSPFSRSDQLNATTNSMRRSIPFAFIGSFLIILITLRSFRYAIVTIVPIALVVIWLYGIMYLFDFSLNSLTSKSLAMRY